MEFIFGIAVGAAFAPFWMMLFNMAKPVVLGWFSKK
jgi:hypothetical protein